MATTLARPPCVALVLGGMGAAWMAHPATANAAVMARWIQMGPGSTATALAAGQYGDQPTSKVPTILARAIIDGGACPALIVDGHLSIPMMKRFDASTLTTGLNSSSRFTDYPDYFVSASASAGSFGNGDPIATTAWTECEAVVPAGHTVARIAGFPLKLPVANPKRILVIADTGCRLNAGAPSTEPRDSVHAVGGAEQNCHDPAAFPFQNLARQAARHKPDLILHLGDYFYRDSGCYKDGREFVPGCSDPSLQNYEPWGDTIDSWNADLFQPGKALFLSAPWVMVRGNHETCGRGAHGWFAFLEPRPYVFTQMNCAKGTGATANNSVTGSAVYSADFTPTYMIPAGLTNLLVHDSSFASDASVDTKMAINFDYDLTALLATLPSRSHNLFVTHKPTYGMMAGATTNAGNFTEQFLFAGSATSGSAFANGISAKITMFLSGHIHQFQYLNFSDSIRYAPQMIVGVSGDNLDARIDPAGSPYYAYSNQMFTVHNTASTTTTTQMANAFSQTLFGFAVLDATPTGYTAGIYTSTGTRAGWCTITLSPRNIACWK